MPMNTYTFQQIEVGTKESFLISITAEMLEQFRAISGDCNPLHCDATFAKENGFSGRVAYGMLTASFYSTLAGVYLPGRYCILYGVDTTFRKPVFIGDELTVSGEVIEKNESVHMIVVKAFVKNQNGEKVSKAKISIGFLPTEPKNEV